MPSEPSWRLKIARAEHHFEDLRGAVERYRQGHHYRAVCPNPPRQPTHWRFVLEITKPPDPQIAIVLGDVLFNIRSALDHVAVALAPKNRKGDAGFPILDVPNDASSEPFERMTRGMPPAAVAIIDAEQPYNLTNRAPKARPDSIDALYTLSALQNADKHRSLAVIVPGISLPTVRILWDEESLGITSPRYLDAGAELVRWSEIGNRIRYEDVRVEVSGTSHVSVNVSAGDDYELLPVAGGILGRVRDRVIPSLEPFVRT